MYNDQCSGNDAPSASLTDHVGMVNCAFYPLRILCTKQSHMHVFLSTLNTVLLF